jgi:hypothetical protein
VCLCDAAAGQPASFIMHNVRNVNAARGLQVQLTGSRCLDMLEKLVFLILPNQVSPSLQLGLKLTKVTTFSGGIKVFLDALLKLQLLTPCLWQATFPVR